MSWTGRFLSLALLSCCASPSVGADWNQWRGPNRDGVARGFKAPASWPKQLSKRWEITVGEGHSSPVFASGKLYQFARQGEQEIIRCLSPQDGKEIWKQSYVAPYDVNAAAQGHGKGPKSTPTVDGNKVFTFGISGILSCWDAGTGKKLWQQEFSRRFKATSPLYGTAASPLIVDGLCIVHVGGHDKGALAAFDVRNGTLRWENTQDGPGYASPILVELAKRKQVITQTQRMLLSVDARTGKRLWQVPFTTAYDQNSVTPLLVGQRVIFSGVDQPTAALRLTGSAERLHPAVEWSNREQSQYMSSPVLVEKWIFGLSHQARGRLFCLDAETGKLRWQTPGRLGENASLTVAGNVLLVLTTDGLLRIVEATSQEYKLLQEYTVAESATWASPCPQDKWIYVKDFEKLIAWEIP